MEIDCSQDPPDVSKRNVLIRGRLGRHSRASGRFVQYDCFLCAPQSLTDCASLLFVNSSSVPFVEIILTSASTVQTSKAEKHAFSILCGSAKIKLAATSSGDKQMWMKALAACVMKVKSRELAESKASEKAVEPQPSERGTPPSTARNAKQDSPKSAKKSASRASMSLLSTPRQMNTEPELRPGVLMSGWLKKKNMVGPPDTRWVEVHTDHCLYYGKDKDTIIAQKGRCVPLSKKSVSAELTKFRLSINDESEKSNSLAFTCASSRETQEWQNAIQFLIDDSILAATNNEGAGAGGEGQHASPHDVLAISAANAATQPPQHSGATISPTSLSEGDAKKIIGMDGNITNNINNDASGVTKRGPTAPVTTAAQELTAEDLLELEDLASDTPTMGLRSQDALALVARVADVRKNGVFLESVSKMYKPTVESPRDLEARVDSSVSREQFPYGLNATLKRLRERMVRPIFEPYAALNEHIILLDMDIEKVRHCLSTLIDDYGNQTGIAHIVLEMDYLLAVYVHVRQHLTVRLQMSAFCEHTDLPGVPLGIHGTMDYLAALFNDPSPPDEATYRDVQQLWRALYDALVQFRLEFDVFDESIDVISQMENALQDAFEWLRLHSRSAFSHDTSSRGGDDGSMRSGAYPSSRTPSVATLY